MSCQFDGSTWLDYTGAPNYNAAYTVSFWFRPESTVTYDAMFGSIANDVTGGDNDFCALNGSGKFETDAEIATAYTTTTGSLSFSANTWYFFGLRRTDVSHLNLFVNTADDVTGTAGDMTGRTAALKVRVGSDSAGDFTNGRMCQIRIWTVALSDGELATEKASTTAVKTSNLWAEWRLASAATALTDSSGNGRDLVLEAGSLTDGADDPPGQGGGGTAGLMWL